MHAIIVILTAIIVLSFQHCGEMTAHRSRTIESVQISDLDSDVPEIDLVSSAYKMSLWEGEFTMTLYLSRNSEELESSNTTLNLIFEDISVSPEATTYKSGDRNSQDTIVNKMNHQISHPFFNSFNLSEFSIKTLEFNNDAAMVLLFNDQLKELVYLKVERSNIPQNIDPIIIDQLEDLQLDRFYTTNLMKTSNGEIDLLLDSGKKISFQEKEEPQTVATGEEKQTGEKQTTCETGSVMLNGKCEGSKQACSIDNGSGEQVLSDSGYGPCEVVSCESGYTQQGNACVASKMACNVDHGTGEQVFSGSGYGDCEVISCDSGYTKKDNACVTSKVACNIDNGTGQKMFSGSDYGTCEVISCDPGYSKENNACVTSKVACNVDNGTGQKMFSGSNYGDCEVISCYAGYSQKGNACVTSKVACNVDNGTGEQVFSDNDYGACKVLSCNSGYSKADSTCIPSKMACNVDNGSGEQVFSGSGYGPCEVVSCESGYTQQGNACLAIKDPVQSQCPKGTFKASDDRGCIEIPSDADGPLFTNPTVAVTDRTRNIVYIYDSVLRAIISVDRVTKKRSVVSGYFVNDTAYPARDEKSILVGEGIPLSNVKGITISRDGKTLYAISNSAIPRSIALSIDVETGNRKSVLKELPNSSYITKIDVDPAEEHMYITGKRCIYKVRISDGQTSEPSHCIDDNPVGSNLSYNKPFGIIRQSRNVAFHSKAGKQYLFSTGKTSSFRYKQTLTECPANYNIANYHPDSNECVERSLNITSMKATYGWAKNYEIFIDEDKNHLNILVEYYTPRKSGIDITNYHTTYFVKIDLSNYQVLDSYQYKNRYRAHRLYFGKNFNDVVILRLGVRNVASSSNVDVEGTTLERYLNESNEHLVKIGNLRSGAFDIQTGKTLAIRAGMQTQNFVTDGLVFQRTDRQKKDSLSRQKVLVAYDPITKSIKRRLDQCGVLRLRHLQFKPGTDYKLYGTVSLKGEDLYKNCPHCKPGIDPKEWVTALYAKDLRNGSCKVKSAGKSLGEGDDLVVSGQHSLAVHPSQELVYSAAYDIFDKAFVVQEINLQTGDRTIVFSDKSDKILRTSSDLALNRNADRLCFRSMKAIQCVDITKDSYPVAAKTSGTYVEQMNFGKGLSDHADIDVDSAGNVYLAGRSEIVKFKRSGDKLEPIELSSVTAGSGTHIGDIDGIRLNSSEDKLKVYDHMTRRLFEVDVDSGLRVMSH